MISVEVLDRTCKKHREEVPLLRLHKTTYVCYYCLDDKLSRVQRYNSNLVKAVEEERRLRGYAQKVLGKKSIQIERLIEERLKDDATINSYKLELENLKIGK